MTDPGANLDRRPCPISAHAMCSAVEDKRVLITGAGGSIGSRLAVQCAESGAEAVIAVDRSEHGLFALRREFDALGYELVTVLLDITSEGRTFTEFHRHRPHVVIHAAAYKHVPMLESRPWSAIQNNVFGTHHVLMAAQIWGADRLLLISTDKAANPTSVMGATKRLAELCVCTRGFGMAPPTTLSGAVRFGNVLDTRGSVLDTWEWQRARGMPVTLTDPDMLRYFISMEDAISLCLRTLALIDHHPHRVFVGDMGDPVRIGDLCDQTWPDAPRRIIGQRPGEKQYEVLIGPEERLESTSDPAISVVHGGDDKDIRAILATLSRASRMPDRELRELLLEHVAASPPAAAEAAT